MPPGELPGPCALCGDLRGARRSGRWACAVCGWRVGDAPDPDLPLPRIDVVYYLRYADRIKIGTSSQPRQRPAAIRHDEVLAFERGGRPLERRRHVEFAHLREGGEWFTATEELAAHIARVGRGTPPWDAYARWMSAELRRRC